MTHLAALHPHDADAPALEFAGQWYAWRWFGDAVAAFDAILANAGLPHGTQVALVARNRPAHIAAMVGAVAAGRRLSMVYSAQATARIADDVRRMGAPVVAADPADWTPELKAAVRETGAIGIELRHDTDSAATVVTGLEKPGSNANIETNTGIAFDLLSSGTTGAPKRVPIKTSTFEEVVRDSTKVHAIGATHTAEAPGILVYPLGNIAGLVYTIPLMFGGQRLVLFEKFQLDSWLDTVRRYRPNRIALPVAALRAILNGNVPAADLESVKIAGVGGSMLPVDLQTRFEDTYGITLSCSFGATEFCGVIVGWTPELLAEWSRKKRGSVGLPRPGVTIRVVDADSGKYLPTGTTGIMEARVQRVGPDWIRTTDLASLDSDGFLYIHGRADQAINRGGFKVLPDTVADALRKHPDVADAAVLGAPDDRLGQVPVAFVEPVEGRRPDAAELRAFAGQHLLAYQVPARVIVLDKLPRTPSMKIRLADLEPLLRT